MNTRVAPFDSEDARKALSYALDRNEIIRLTSGPQLSQPTCQILPPNSPGYKPYCPFTLHPASSGTWRAPDLATARKLMARSHTRGSRVTVVDDTIPNTRNALAATSFSFSTALATRLRARQCPRHHRQVAGRSRVHAQPSRSISSQWFADYPSAAAFIQASFSCGGADQRHRILRSENRPRDAPGANPRNPPIPVPQMLNGHTSTASSSTQQPGSHGRPRRRSTSSPSASATSSSTPSG